MESLSVHTIPSPLGDLHAGFSENGLCYLGFHDQKKNPIADYAKKNGFGISDSFSSHLKETARTVEDYFNGKEVELPIPMDLRGTAFQKKVWRSLMDIPFGERRTYTDQANALGDLAAIRAMAAANGSNPISILIPCHRVVGTDGSLTGYASGLHRKKALLELEAKACGKAVQMPLFD